MKRRASQASYLLRLAMQERVHTPLGWTKANEMVVMKELVPISTRKKVFLKKPFRAPQSFIKRKLGYRQGNCVIGVGNGAIAAYCVWPLLEARFAVQCEG